jgi:creatinine amidohydrolase
MQTNEKEVDLSRMSWPEVQARLEAGLRLAIIPVGSFEQHGPHLPLRTDFMLAYGRATRIARLVEGVVVPVVTAGCSDHHLDFPGTVSLRPETLIDILTDAARSLMKHGFDRLVLLNGHGGNDTTLKAAVQTIRRKVGMETILFGVTEISAYFPEESALNLDIHAGLMETAAMLIYAPDDVHMENAQAPRIQFEDPVMQRWLDTRESDALGFKVLRSRLPAIREFSDNGVVTLLDPTRAPESVALREDVEERFGRDVAAFITKWLEIGKEKQNAEQS